MNENQEKNELKSSEKKPDTDLNNFLREEFINIYLEAFDLNDDKDVIFL